MVYYPTDEDLQILNKKAIHSYCKIDLLNNDMVTIDSLEGLVMAGSISIDADSDIRRTFSSTIYLNNKSEISNIMVEEWISKFVRIHIGLEDSNGEIKWWPQGVYVFNQNGFSYSATEHTLSVSCVDLVARLDGSLGGQLVGYSTEVEEDSNIRNAIVATLQLSDFKKHLVDYWDRTVPYTLEYDTGVNIWDILKELRDLYYPFEMYFDDDTFVCKEIPSGFGDPSVLDSAVFANFVISEDASVDYTEVKNCVEVFGAIIESDYYAATCSLNESVLTLNLSDADLSNDTRISFLFPGTVNNSKMSVTIVNSITTTPEEGGEPTTETQTIGPYILYEANTDDEGNDVEQDPSVMKSNKYYVIEYSEDMQKFYFLGQQQAHAMVKLVDTIPSEEEIIEQEKIENCDNLKFISVNDPTTTNTLYNSRFTIEKIGQRNKVLSGGSYDNYTTDESAMEVCQYEHWKSCRLTDTVTVQTILIPWLDVNQKLSYAAKYLNSNIPVEFLIKKIDMTLGDGTMSITMCRYYPYYPYIVEDKYTS